MQQKIKVAWNNDWLPFKYVTMWQNSQLYIKRLSFLYEEKWVSTPQIILQTQREFWQHETHIRTVIKVCSQRSQSPRGLKETRHQVFMCDDELPAQIADNRPVAWTCHRPPLVNRQLDVSCYASLVYHGQRFSLWLSKGLFQMFVIKSMFLPEACRPVSANKNQSFVKTIGGHTRDGSFMSVPG